ncbi:hypothetical protein JTE90_022112 [Oedothorax gibbosus]|uniref:Ionotropic glutamate receptor L-glutamate and glycine-binding domain-containing protein n=1 Tax=Oedothorax gibbosus TaxID=931172 RepID=A0AAV6VV88_9ARAC|nr:hypothetical protein JTE90_022112 [Oedothorax gibbosus]
MQKLRVRFANWHPYSIVKHSQGKIELGGGIVKEIYEGIKAVKGLDYEAIFQPGNHFGERIANGTWTGMLGSTINNETEIAGPLYISEERSLFVEFSKPIGFGKLGILTGLVHTNKHPFLIFGIFSWKTLIGTRYESIYHKVEKNLYRNINETTPEWMDRVENGRLVFIGPLSQMKNNIGNRFLATGKCGLRVTGMHWGSSYIALIFGKHFRDTSILRQFNQFLQRFNEGNIAHLEISHSDLYYDICTATSTAVSKALKLSDLLGAFIVFVSGMIISICVLVIELIVK